MKTKLIITLIVGMTTGFIFRPMITTSSQSTDTNSDEKKIAYWVAPMDANYRRDKPGKSPMGMDLVPVYEGEDGDDASVVSVSPRVVNSLGVRTETVTESPVVNSIDTFGHVQFDENKQSHIHSRVDGWIEYLAFKAVGDEVKKGDVLLKIYSPQLVNALQEYKIALASKNNALISASEERLLSLGVSENQIKSQRNSSKLQRLVTLYADKDGFITNLPIKEGMFIKPATTLMSISELDPVWVMADVFERQSHLVHVGQKAQMSLDFLPGENVTGVVDYVYPQLDAQTRTLKVRMKFSNSNQLLKPNMYANIHIQGDEIENVVSVPSQAVIRGGAGDRVILAQNEGRYKAVPVVIGAQSNGRTVIKKGLELGQQVVVSGQFLLDSEANIDAELARLDDNMQIMPVMPTTVDTMGSINNIMINHAMINLTHAPIKAWDWPSMTMDLKVDKAIDLSQFKPQDHVMVTIENKGKNQYLITNIMKHEM